MAATGSQVKSKSIKVLKQVLSLVRLKTSGFNVNMDKT